MADRLQRMESALRKAHEAGNTEDAQKLAAAISAERNQTPTPANATTVIEQGLSGVNEGIADLLGMPVDIVTAGLNAGVSGINSAAGTNIPSIQQPLGGSETFRNILGPTISDDDPATSGQRYARRIGREVGAMAVPYAGTAGRSVRPIVDALIAGTSAVGSGAAGQLAEDMGAGESGQVIASVLGGMAPVGAASVARRASTNAAARKAVPSVDDLKAQAGRLYDEAERTGITAPQPMTQSLASNMNALATREGIISPTGRVSTAYPKVREALKTFDDFASGEMNVPQMKSVRKTLSGAARSADREEARIASMMLREFDDFVAPLAPPLKEARAIYHRAMKGNEIETAMELAGVRAGQFSGSGYENALRTDFRALDRKLAKGDMKGYTPAEREAIARVNRGTTGSNIARGVGKAAPTGAVSTMASGGLPWIAGNAVGGPAVGSAAAALTMGTGIAGRKIATDMTRRHAEMASLLARNGGPIHGAAALSEGEKKIIAALMAAQASRQ